MPKLSAGLLLFRRVDDGVEVLIAHPGGPIWSRRDAGAWSLPKGATMDHEADLLETARREFHEETGHLAPDGEVLDLGEVRMRSGKVVRGYAVEGDLDPATLRSMQVEVEWPPQLRARDQRARDRSRALGASLRGTPPPQPRPGGVRGPAAPGARPGVARRGGRDRRQAGNGPLGCWSRSYGPRSRRADPRSPAGPQTIRADPAAAAPIPSPTAPERVDVAVIGAGIVGLATALRLLEARPGLRLAVLEGEDRVAAHQSGHNSGVVHAGLYYAPGSQKALLCREGKGLLERYCEAHGIPIAFPGKLVVALDEAELPRLEALRTRGEANGVDGLEEVGPERIREIEPHVAGIRALWSPRTGITDFARVTRAYADDVAARGGAIELARPVTAIERRPDGLVLATAARPDPGLERHRLRRALGGPGGGDDG